MNIAFSSYRSWQPTYSILISAIEGFNSTPYFSLPFIYRDWGGLTAIVEQIAKNREKGVHSNAGEIISFLGNFGVCCFAHRAPTAIATGSVLKLETRAFRAPFERSPPRGKRINFCQTALKCPKHRKVSVAFYQRALVFFYAKMKFGGRVGTV